MGLFTKKPKKEEEKNNNQGIVKEFRVVLKEKIARGITRNVRTFNVARWRDPKDDVIYIKSIEDQKNPINFLEIYPGDMDKHNKVKIEDVKKKIKDLEEKLEKELQFDDPNINHKNFEYDLLKLKAQERALKYNNDASYITFLEDGTPELIYLRDGSEFHPFKWDTDTETIYTPSEAKKKSVVASLRNKENKYKLNDKVTGIAIILLVIGTVLVLGNIFLGLKLWSSYDESKIAELEASNLRTLDHCSQVVKDTSIQVEKTAKTVGNVAKQVDESVNRPIVTGILPE